mmetsp:Transcript_31253/g.36670  ORF Transcript_31253/g.36670 Transcript_31253/m.36670 type:complete len:89 (-) Transcript_31253:1457-1723(-)
MLNIIIIVAVKFETTTEGLRVLLAYSRIIFFDLLVLREVEECLLFSLLNLILLLLFVEHVQLFIHVGNVFKLAIFVCRVTIDNQGFLF